MESNLSPAELPTNTCKPRKRKDEQKKKEKKKGSSRNIETLYRSAYRTWLELTGIADAKANIMISVNGLIITSIIATTGLFIS